MDMKRIQMMRQVLSNAYDSIQQLNIQATIFNVTNIEENLKRLQLVYNTLGEMSEEIEKDGAKDGTNAK